MVHESNWELKRLNDNKLCKRIGKETQGFVMGAYEEQLY